MAKEIKPTTKDVVTVFRYWNYKKETMIHRVFSDKRKKKIASTIKVHGLDDILKAIFNYATILSSTSHFWTYSWTIEDFLQRGLEKFLDEANPYDNFHADYHVNKGGAKQKAEPNPYKDRFEQYKRASLEERERLTKEWAKC